MKVLIVDDIVSNRKVLRVTFEAHGHSTLEAADGIEALEILARETVDAVLSDILMPRMDGYRLCQEIRTNERLRELPIVMYTSTYTSASDEKLALSLGADGYLKKPAPFEIILAALHEAIAMTHSMPRPDAWQEVEVLKEYSDRLVTKLEERNIELALANERLSTLHAVELERASAQRLRNITDNLTEGLVISAMSGQLLHMNQAAYEMFDFSEEQWSQRPADLRDTFELSTLDGRVLGAEAWPLARIIAGEHLCNLELGMRRIDIDFTPRILSYSGQVVEDGSGSSVAFLSFSDISVRKEAERQLARTMRELKRSNGELEQFSYVASHDLQEPLRMVASYMQLLSERYRGRLDSNADEFIAYALDGSNRMQQLIRDLLAYSRVGSDARAPRNISSELALQSALTNLQAAIEESGAVVTHDPLPMLTTDETQLSQVFQNLVGNAIKYRSADVPDIHVSAATGGDNEWIFSVRDNGLGISPDNFDKIFVLFQRLHRREEIAGTGIGLSICKKMLEGLGGRIWVDSQLHKGSTFHFAVPQGVAT